MNEKNQRDAGEVIASREPLGGHDSAATGSGGVTRTVPLRRLLVVVTAGVTAIAAALLGTVYVTSTNAILWNDLDSRVGEVLQRLDKPKPGPNSSAQAQAQAQSQAQAQAQTEAQAQMQTQAPEAQLAEDRPQADSASAAATVERLLTKRGSGNPEFVLVVGSDGEVYAGVPLDGGVARVSGDAIDALAATPPLGEFLTAELPDIGRYRLSAATDQQGIVVVVGMSTAATEAISRQSIAVAVWVSLGVVILAGVLVMLLVRRALRPLQEVVQTASAVSRAELLNAPEVTDRRVPDAASDERTEAGLVGASLNRLLDRIFAVMAQRDATEQRLRVFVADASHELRTPLASIRGYAELTRLSGEQLPPDSAHALRRIEEESKRMGVIVEDLLQLARLDHEAPMREDRVDMHRLVRDAVQDARAAAPSHRIRLLGSRGLEIGRDEACAAEANGDEICGDEIYGDEVEKQLLVRGDADQLRQAVGNVMSNAWKHTPAGTEIIASARDESGWVIVEISDSGPGLPQEMVGRVFERFVRVDTARSRETGGSGLGLSIARSVAEAHGGSIAVSSTAGETTFVLRVPSLLGDA